MGAGDPRGGSLPGEGPGRVSELLRFSQEHWKYLRSNNCLERVFGEVKRRTRLMGAFRNEKSCTLVFFAVIRALRFRRIPIPEILHKT